MGFILIGLVIGSVMGFGSYIVGYVIGCKDTRRLFEL